MSTKIDLTGQTFGRLTVIAEVNKLNTGGRRRIAWQCRCSCGNLRVFTLDTLRRGMTKSCGCYRYELLAAGRAVMRSHRGPHIDLTGRQFTYLTVIEKSHIDKHGCVCYKCRCKCGNIHVAKGHNLTRGTVKSCGCYRSTLAIERTRNKLGINSPAWKGGKTTNADGYVMVYAPNHTNATANGRVMEHRLVMEKIIGRALKKNETVHHRNGNRADNRPENLELWAKITHPYGQRVTDLVNVAKEILKQYGHLCNSDAFGLPTTEHFREANGS